MESILVLTISGRDRAGLVENLAAVVAEHGGNWERCRMAHLSGRFVGLLELSVPGDCQQELESALRTMKDLDVMIAAGEPEVEADASGPQQFDLEILGMDHPGIVREVFKALAEAEVNVEELSTKVYSAPDSGMMLFEAKARLACGPETERATIRRKLEKIAQDILVDIRLVD